MIVYSVILISHHFANKSIIFIIITITISTSQQYQYHSNITITTHGPSSAQTGTRTLLVAHGQLVISQTFSLIVLVEFTNFPFNPISQGVSISLPPRSCFRPHVAKSYFETYKRYDHMQNFRPLSQKFSEISRFEKFEFLRFCLTLTHRNCHNWLNF